MFGNRRSYNDIFRAFDEMFTQLTPSISNGEWKTQTKVSEDGTMKITTYYYDNAKTNPTSKNLKQQLEIAIENEDFEKAVELRDQLKKLESNQKEIDKLEEELKKSIEEQNFEKSIEIRDQLKKLK
jgi:protein-arginine kinase activator protein McsA